MNESVTINLYSKTQNKIITLDKIINFNFKKDYYVPYTNMSANCVTDDEFDDVAEAELVIDGKILHRGLIDGLKTYFNNGHRCMSFKSRGKSVLLLSNELSEGILSGASLPLIMGKKNIQGVNFESYNTSTNYIYVSEHASMWEALTNTCLKLKGGFPYIKGANTVCFTKDIPKQISLQNIIATGEGSDFSKAISTVYMKDLEDKYSIFKTDSQVTAMGIVREKYLPLDRQWLADSDTGLKYRINFALRGSQYRYLTYRGYKGEDILDRISNLTSDNQISRIDICYTKSDLKTTIYFYKDRYCNI